MIDLPTKMLKELEEEGSMLPRLVLFHNLREAAEKAQEIGEGKIEAIKLNDNETKVSGWFILKDENKNEKAKTI